jgi:hypothetical protein
MPLFPSRRVLSLIGIVAVVLVATTALSTTTTTTEADASQRTSSTTTSIADGTHPQISFAENVLDPKRADLRIRFKEKGGDKHYNEYDDGPRYFLVLSDQVVEQEVAFRVRQDRWSDRVLLEKLYFGLLYGTSGLPPQYNNKNNNMKQARELQSLEAAEGWEILDRTSDFCDWEGVTCGRPGTVTEIHLDNMSLQGTLPEDLYFLSNLEHIDLKGKERKRER